MVVTRKIETFVRENDSDMRAIACSRTGIHDTEILNELMARFYTALLQNKTLDKWDPTKGRYETYTTTMLMWVARKMGDEGTITVCIDRIAPPSYDPSTDPVRRLRERLGDYNRYLQAEIGATGAYEVRTYIQSKIEGYADRELGIGIPRIRRMHKKWVANYRIEGDPS